MAIGGLAALGIGGEAMIPWAAKPSELPAQAGYAGLVALGEAARPAIAAARASKKPKERAVGDAVAAMLDDKDWASVRAARRSDYYLRLVKEWRRRNFSNHPSWRKESMTPKDLWAYAAVAIDAPREWWRRSALLDEALEFGGAKAFAPIADVLLRYPPFADDVQLSAIARGAKMPSVDEVRAMADQRGARPRAANAPKPTQRKSAKAKPKARAKAKPDAKAKPKAKTTPHAKAKPKGKR